MGFASLHCKNSFAIPENGDLTITWEISDFTSDGIGEWSYSVQLSVAALGFVASDTATFANIYEREAPTISIKLSIHPELDSVDFGVRYKDGSGKNEHAIHQHGPALNSQPITFSRWDTANNGRHEICANGTCEHK